MRDKEIYSCGQQEKAKSQQSEKGCFQAHKKHP